MEEERCARVVPPSVATRDQVELPPPAIDNRLTVHALWPEVSLKFVDSLNIEPAQVR